MELLKTILTFISSIAYPLVFGILLILFREQIRGILDISRQLLVSLKKSGIKLEKFKFAGIEMELAQKVTAELAQDPDSAAKIIQDLLSPAAPLALGYFDNFLKGLIVERGGFKFVHNEQLHGRQIKKVFTICVPVELPKDWDSSPSLVNAAYPNEQIENISIESLYGRPFTAFAILKGTTLYPVDVPKTLTSIQRVFEYRGEQLLKAKVDAVQIKELEGKNLDTFDEIIRHQTRDLQQSGCVRIIRKPSQLFSDSAAETIRRDVVG